MDVNHTTYGSLSCTTREEMISRWLVLETSRQLLPEVYAKGVLRPFTRFLESLPADEVDVLLRGEDKHYAQAAKLVEDMAGIFFQRLPSKGGDLSFSHDLMAFQTVVSTIYNSAIQRLREEAIGVEDFYAPLAKWDYNGSVIRTRRIKDIREIQEKIAPGSSETFKIKAGVVVLPLNYRIGGIFAWAVLGHEVGGHSVLDACPTIVRQAVEMTQIQMDTLRLQTDIRDEQIFVDYWNNKSRLEEILSDLLGILISGPALAIGMIGYLKGMKKGSKELLVSGDFRDVHPSEILRVLVISYAIDILKPPNFESYKGFIEEEIYEALKGLQELTFEGQSKQLKISFEFAKTTCHRVADILLNGKLVAHKSLRDVMKWEEEEEVLTLAVKDSLEHKQTLSFPVTGYPLQARFVVPAAILAAVGSDLPSSVIFEKMKSFLLEARKKFVPSPEPHDEPAAAL